MKLPNFLSMFSRKNSATNRMVTMFLQNGGSTPKDQNEAKLAAEGYSQTGIAYACVREIAVAFAGIKWGLFKTIDGERVEIDEHPMLRLWNRPNPHQGSSAFLQSVASHYLIAGNAYIEAATDSMGEPQFLYSLRPDRMTVIPDRSNRIGGYRYSMGGSAYDFIGGEVMHFKDFHPTNDWYGLSPIAVAAMSIDSYKNQQKWNSGLLANSARPSGIITYEDDLSPEALNNIREEFQQKFSGSQNANKPLILEGGKMKWEQMAFNAKELDFVESQNLSALQIAQIFNLPPELVGLQPSTYQNRREARKALYTENVLPMADRFRDDFNTWLAPMFGAEGLYFEPDLDDIEALQEDREKLWTRLDASEDLTLNERRIGKGYDEVENGDVIFISSSKMSLDDMLAPPEPMPADTDTNTEDDEDADTENNDDDFFSAGKEAKQSRNNRKEMLAIGRMRKRFSRKLAVDIRTLFKKEHVRVAEALDKYGALFGQNVIHAIDESKERWERIIPKNRTSTMRAFGDRALDGFKADNPDIETKVAQEDIFVQQMRVAAQLHVAEMITNISEATKRKVRTVIEDGAIEGSPIATIKKDIRQVYKRFGEKRAGVIALTETVTAQNRGSLEAINSLKVPVLKVWLWSQVERSTHSDADGQEVEKDGFFIVDGEELLHPGDPTASAKNRINCTCGITYRRDRS